jgi:acetoin utilization deacetylase AcuC-like enzyme
MRLPVKTFMSSAALLGERASFPPFVYHDGYSCPWPENHRFPMNKFRMLKDALVNSGIYRGPFVKPPHPIETSDGMDVIYAVHCPDYIGRFVNGKLTAEEKRRIGLDFNEHLVFRTLAEVGGTVHTADLALKYGMAINLAGGTHHAHYDFGSGFTVINDLAVASRRAIDKSMASSILVFDLDVHQGDGTAAIFQSDNRIFTTSVHCRENFPFRKQKSSLDVELPAGTEDVAYMHAVRDAFEKSVAAHNPDLVLYDAGVDIAKEDRLGKLNITNKGIYERDFYVLSECVRRGIPVCAVIGGGYDSNPYALAARHSLLHRAAIEVWRLYKMGG